MGENAGAESPSHEASSTCVSCRGGPPSTGPGTRRTLYVQHYAPRALELIGPYQGYNQIMPGYGEGDIPNIDEMRERVEGAEGANG